MASIYATIEGKSSRADEIVRETQQIIADKMEIEMEIDTLMTAAKSEVNIMLGDAPGDPGHHRVPPARALWMQSIRSPRAGR